VSFDILRSLAGRLDAQHTFSQGRDYAQWLRHIFEKWRDGVRTNRAALPDFETFWNDGYFEIPRGSDEYVLFGDFRTDPERHRLRTPSGRIELYSNRIAGFGYADCPPHPSWIEPAEWLGAATGYPLHLVSSQPEFRLHSQMDGGPVSARGKVAGREAIHINPVDAGARGIAAGDVVLVRNDRGACLAGAVVTDAVRPGVVRLSCGAWYDPQDEAADGLCRHGNANVLTRDRGTSKLAQGPSSATATVEIERYAQTAPPVGAFTPPPVSTAPAVS
jgi:biotin/methionine sulfoxide reductase